jgi:predicted restriction endonuclease
MLVRKHNKKTKNLVKSQAWPQIDGSDISRRIWLFLEKRSHHLIGKIGETDADSNDDDSKGSSLQSGFGGLSVAKQILCRRGQKRFRDALMKRYGCRCMISGCELMDVIEAAHIVPFKEEKKHKVANGILLRADLHTLFDLNLIGINPDTHEFFLSKKVRGIEEYQQFHKQPLILNEAVDLSKKYLSLKWRQFREKQETHE